MNTINNSLLFKRNNILFWILSPALYLFSLIYGFLVGCIKFSYNKGILSRYKSKLKIISVGNITVGGSGKTPFVEWLVEFLQEENKRIGIIIRGYKKFNKGYGGLVKDGSSYLEVGDEAAMLKEKFKGIKICVGKDKIGSARQLERENCDLAIMDDGFQHWRLKRDLDIVIVDASLPFAREMLLPLGRLRESLNGLKRAGIFCLTKVDIAGDNYLANIKLLNKINPEALQVSAVYEAVGFYNLKTDVFSSIDLDKPVAILCGIASPSYFEKMLEKAGLKIGRRLIYSDHHNYSERDLKFIRKVILDNNIDMIITTHKDAVRLKQLVHILGDVKIFYLQIKLKIIENEKVLRARLLSLLSR